MARELRNRNKTDASTGKSTGRIAKPAAKAVQSSSKKDEKKLLDADKVELQQSSSASSESESDAGFISDDSDAEIEGDDISGLAGSGDDDDNSHDGEDSGSLGAAASKLKHSVIRKIHNDTAEPSDSSDPKPVQAKHIIYIGRIPHGFYEVELRKYFEQFGNIRNLRVLRNKKSGQLKHYGFIEFDAKVAAETAAETMNNYLLFGHLLRCEVVQGHHPNLFKDANKKFVKVSHAQRIRARHEQPKSAGQWAALQKQHEHRKLQRVKDLAEKGIHM